MPTQTGSIDLRAVKQAYIKTVAKAQPIYKRTNTTSVPSPPTSTITATTDQGTSGNWTTMHMARLCSTNFNYKYLWTCNQLLAPDGTFLGTTDVVADNGTTVINGDEIATGTIAAARLNIADTITAINNNSTTTINGGKITTGTLSASAVDAASGTFNTANIPNLSADKITTGTINIGRIPSGALNSELASDITNAGNTANNYITAIDNNGIQIHAVNSSTTNYSQIDANGLNVVKGGTSVASFGDSVRIGKEAYGHVSIYSDGLYVQANDDGSTVSGSTDVSYITSNGVHIGNNVTRIFSTHNPDVYSGDGANSTFVECHSSNGVDSVVYTQAGIHAIADTQDKECSVTVHANDDTGDTYTIITGDDLYIESNTSISGSLTLGGHDSPVGTMLSNSASVAITTANINTYAVGPGIVLSPGSWIIRGTWQYNSATGARVIDVDLATDNSTAASTTTLIARQRVSNATGAWARLEVISLVTPTTDTPVYIKGSATLTSTAQACYIYAMRIA